jgi:hypothetical protein
MRYRSSDSRGDEERQLSDFAVVEPAGGVAGHRPGDVGHAVLHQLELLDRAAAERAAGEHFDHQRTAGGIADLLRPWDEHLAGDRRLRGLEARELQRDRLLGEGAAGEGRSERDPDQCVFHQLSPPGGPAALSLR